MNGPPHVKIWSTGVTTAVIEIDGEDATNGLRALAVTMRVGDVPSVMMEYAAVPSFEGLAKCTVNVSNPLRDALGRIDLEKLRTAVAMSDMSEHPADVVLEELILMVDQLEAPHVESGA
jgi:hypothetical protein